MSENQCNLWHQDLVRVDDLVMTGSFYCLLTGIDECLHTLKNKLRKSSALKKKSTKLSSY